MQRVYRCFTQAPSPLDDEQSDHDLERGLAESTSDTEESSEAASIEHNQCSNAFCCCGFCICIPLWTMIGLVGGCQLTMALESTVRTLYGASGVAALGTCLPSASILTGIGTGFTLWGKTADAADECAKTRMVTGQSCSIKHSC